MLTLKLGLLWSRDRAGDLQRSLPASIILGDLWYYATSSPKSCLLNDKLCCLSESSTQRAEDCPAPFSPCGTPGGETTIFKFSFRCWLLLRNSCCRKGHTQDGRRKKSKSRADRIRGQQAAARGVQEGVLHVPTRMVMHTSTDTFDIEVNHVFQLFGERHCCGFGKDDLQVQPKPSH